MIVKLLGVGKRALDRLLAAFVDRLAPGRQAVGIGALAFIGPDMTGDGAGRSRVSADRRVGAIVATAGAMGIGGRLRFGISGRLNWNAH